ncbi:MAG: CinA family protein [Cohaesibacter sp.]|nr:CinA family protein [Cohaesibacter sp.]
MHLLDSSINKAEQIISLASERNWMIATAESCTAGLIAATLTEVAGSSAVLDRGFVTYSNQAKTEMLSVPQETLLEHGAVSQATAKAMARGAIANSCATLSIAVTGIAGPGGGSADKPVGLVHFGIATISDLGHDVQIFKNHNRQQIRALTVDHALSMLLVQLQTP